VATQLDELRARQFDFGQLVLLVVIRNRFASLAICADPLFEGRVIQFAMQAQPDRQPFFLAGIRIEFEGHFASLHDWYFIQLFRYSKMKFCNGLCANGNQNRSLDPLLT
jgi:hypothetical protein